MKRVLLVALFAAGGCDDNCRTPSQRGPGLSGTFHYTAGDGASYDGSLAGFQVELTGTAISITGSFEDDFGDTRTFTIETADLAAGTGPIDVAGLADVCMRHTAGAAPVCAPLAGMLDVRQLVDDCFHHESGVSACAQTIELTLDASAAWNGTTFSIDAEELTIGEWVEIACE